MGRGARRARRVLVVAQVAFAFTLLVAAGVLAVSFRKVTQVDPGFEPRGVESARLSLPAARYPDDAALVAFSERLLEGVRRSPGSPRRSASPLRFRSAALTATA